MSRNVKVVIKEKEISPVNSFLIHQEFNEHHTFECSFDGDVIQDATNKQGLEKFQHWLGEKISIQMDD